MCSSSILIACEYPFNHISVIFLEAWVTIVVPHRPVLSVCQSNDVSCTTFCLVIPLHKVYDTPVVVFDMVCALLERHLYDKTPSQYHLHQTCKALFQPILPHTITMTGQLFPPKAGQYTSISCGTTQLNSRTPQLFTSKGYALDEITP